MEMTNNNCCKLYIYGFKRNHYEKWIGIREFLGQTDLDCFNNPFSTDTGTPVKKVPLFGEVYGR